MRSAVFALLLCGCLTPTKPDDIDGAGCVEACANMERLGCIGGRGDGHATCAQACADLEAEGFVPLHTECVAGATTCEGVDACAQ
jgi:hypothetical protein